MTASVGFDLDNTLYDEASHLMPFFPKAACWIAQETGADRQEAEALLVRTWRLRTSAYGFLFDDVLTRLGCHRREYVRALVELYRSHRSELALYPETGALLERLARNFPLFLITDGNARSQHAKIEALGISRYFRVIICTDELGGTWHKPSPLPFAHAASLLGVHASACVFVGDDPSRDVAGAHYAGMRAALLSTGDRAPKGGLPAPDFVLRSLSALERELCGGRPGTYD